MAADVTIHIARRLPVLIRPMKKYAPAGQIIDVSTNLFYCQLHEQLRAAISCFCTFFIVYNLVTRRKKTLKI